MPTADPRPEQRAVPSAAPARVVLAADPFPKTLDYFTGPLGFRIDVISPADDPDRAVVSLGPLTVILDRHANEATGPGSLEIPTDDPDLANTTDVAPNGTVVRFLTSENATLTQAPVLPELKPSLVVSRGTSNPAGKSAWVTGRAGMQYRDLIPDRQGGRFIASHIKVPGSGPVPDWVHYHDIRFQIIYCRSGAATLVYEDQGEPFRFETGDCVLQPPGIRHRVLETFDDMEVIELGCPARHDTFADHDMELPTGQHQPERQYNGQRFVHFRAAGADSSTTSSAEPWTTAGWDVVTTSISDATNGLGSVRVITRGGQQAAAVGPATHEGELMLLYILDGTVELSVGTAEQTLTADDSVVIPGHVAWSLTASSHRRAATRILEVTVTEIQSYT